MASRKIEDLHPTMQAFALEFLARCEQANLDVLIYCTYRSPQEQAELWKEGRETPGTIKTWSPPWHSKHQWGLAFDCCPMLGGKCLWEPRDHPLWLAIGAIGESLGLRWGGRWRKKKRENPHFELPLHSSEDLLAGRFDANDEFLAAKYEEMKKGL